MPKVYIHHYCHGEIVIKKLKDISQNSQNRRSGEKENCIYETYNNTVMPHGSHIYDKSYEMAKATMCAYSQSDHVLLHWKCILRCCSKWKGINISDEDTYDKHPNLSPSICFQIYHLIAKCTEHGRLTLTNQKKFRECKQGTASGQSTKYTLEKI